MKYCTGALVLIALLGVTVAVDLKNHNKNKAGFTDDLVKSLSEDMVKDLDAEPTKEAGEAESSTKKEAAVSTTTKEAAATTKKVSAKKDEKKKDTKKKKAAAKPVAKKEKTDDEIPMDAAAIKAYSSVIADAAEDSEPAQPVQYHQIADLDGADTPKPKARDAYNPDPMGSMIQNEISSIKDASIKAAKEKDE